MFWKPQQTPYVNYLPEPEDALINLLREVVRKHASISEFKVGLSTLEAPSARLSIELYQIEQYGCANLHVGVAGIQQPDPRIAHKPVDFVLWEYAGTDPRATLPVPPESAATAVSQLAGQPYSEEKWAREGRRIAARLGAEQARGILAVMEHPPARPKELAIWDWLRRVQVAAGYILAYTDQGWEDSLRQRLLFSLARGPMDWTVEAALLPLCHISKTEPATRNSIAELYFELLRGLPGPGGVPYRSALLWCIAEIIESVPEPALQIKLSRCFIDELKMHGK